MTRDELEHIIRASGETMDVEQQRRLRATIRRWSSPR